MNVKFFFELHLILKDDLAFVNKIRWCEFMLWIKSNYTNEDISFIDNEIYLLDLLNWNDLAIFVFTI